MNNKLVTPGVFENFLVIGLSIDLLPKFGGKLTFSVYVNRRGRLCLISEQTIR